MRTKCNNDFDLFEKAKYISSIRKIEQQIEKRDYKKQSQKEQIAKKDL